MAVWALNKLGCIPRFVGVVYAIGLGTTFIVAVLRRDTTPYLPYISDTGSKPPESGLFSITLYTMATLGIITMLLRYMIIEECNQEISKSLTILSKVSLFFGILSMCGMIIVGAYPQTSVPTAHGIGALLLFLNCCVYGVLETVISYKMVPCNINKSTSVVRTVIAVIAAVVFVTSSIVTSVGLRSLRSMIGWSGGKYPGEPGFAYVVTGAACEWTMSLLFLAFFLTFVVEFRGVSIFINVRYISNKQSHVGAMDSDETERIFMN